MQSQDIFMFALTGIVLNLTPGPDVLLVVRHALRSGALVGVWAGLGVATGCLVHVGAAALGLSALLANAPQAFSLLKWAGAAYLVYVAVGLARAAWTGSYAWVQADLSQHLANPARTAFFQGLVTNVLNPKVALFFLAFVPQFIPGDVVDKPRYFLALGALFIFNSVLVSSAYALAAAWMTHRAAFLQSTMRWLDALAACIFLTFGIQLALADAPSSP